MSATTLRHPTLHYWNGSLP